MSNPSLRATVPQPGGGTYSGLDLAILVMALVDGLLVFQEPALNYDVQLAFPGEERAAAR